MDGYDIQRFERLKEIAKEYDVSVRVHGDKIAFIRDDGMTLGHSATVAEAFAYICGYSAGYDRASAVAPTD